MDLKLVFMNTQVQRDLYAELFRSLGANVISLGRSDEFVPIDTEAVADIDKEYGFDTIFSTDGDRPLIADDGWWCW
jgi:phosphomannomutase